MASLHSFDTVDSITKNGLETCSQLRLIPEKNKITVFVGKEPVETNLSVAERILLVAAARTTGDN